MAGLQEKLPSLSCLSLTAWRVDDCSPLIFFVALLEGLFADWQAGNLQGQG